MRLALQSELDDDDVVGPSAPAIADEPDEGAAHLDSELEDEQLCLEALLDQEDESLQHSDDDDVEDVVGNVEDVVEDVVGYANPDEPAEDPQEEGAPPPPPPPPRAIERRGRRPQRMEIEEWGAIHILHMTGMLALEARCPFHKKSGKTRLQEYF